MTNEERLAKCEAAMANLVTAMDVLTRTVSELTDKVAELDERIGKSKGTEIVREIEKVDYDADECCASCKYLYREKGSWYCRLNNMNRDIVDPATRVCIGYEGVRKEKEEKHLCTGCRKKVARNE